MKNLLKILFLLLPSSLIRLPTFPLWRSGALKIAAGLLLNSITFSVKKSWLKKLKKLLKFTKNKYRRACIFIVYQLMTHLSGPENSLSSKRITE